MLLICTFLMIFDLCAATFEELKTLATERSLSLQAQELEARALKADASTAGRWQNPLFSGQFGTLRSGSSQGATTEVSLTQPIPLSDRFGLRRQLGELAVSQQKTRSEFYRLWVRHQAVLAGWRVTTAQALYEHRVERSRRLGLIKSNIESRPRVSSRQRVELALIRTALLRIEGYQEEKASELKRALADLEFWTGKQFLPQDLRFSLPKEVLETTPSLPEQSASLELTLARDNLRGATLEAELARKERRPDLLLGAGHRLEAVAPRNYFNYVILGFTVPLWDTGDGRLEAASVRRRVGEHELRQVEREVGLKLLKLSEELTLARARIKRFSPDLIPKTERSLQEAEAGFRQGLIDANVFLQAETQFHEVIDEVYHAWVLYLETLSDSQITRKEELSWQPM